MIAQRNKSLVIFSLLAPGLAIYALALLGPMIMSLILGLTNYTGIGRPDWVGFVNYRELLFDDPVFWRSVWHSVLLGIVTVAVQHPLAIGLGVLLDKLEGRTETFFRAIFFIPAVVSIVIVARMWVGMFDPQYGFINKFLGDIGLSGLQSQWLADAQMAIWVIIFIVIWQSFGWTFLIYYAGLKGVPKELYEAAEIDGSTGFSAFRNITVPLLRPVIKVNITFTVVNAFKQMEIVYLTTNGGPANRTQFLGNYLYTSAFSSFEYGYANAISVMFVATCMLVAFLLDRVLKAESYE